MIVGCYTLDLYCETEGCPMSRCTRSGEDMRAPASYNDELGSTCRRRARRDGWRLDLREGTALCPKCADEKRKREKAIRDRFLRDNPT